MMDYICRFCYSVPLVELPKTVGSPKSLISRIDAVLASRDLERPVECGPLPGLWFSRCSAPTEAAPSAFEPMLCLITRGTKRISFNNANYDYTAGTFLVVGTHLPATAQIISAPCLGLTLMLDLATVNDLVARHTVTDPLSNGDGLGVYNADEALLEALLRLLKILDDPAALDVLGSGIKREITFHLVRGPARGMLAAFAHPRRRLVSLSAAIELMRKNIDRILSVQDLANAAGMSVQTFHREFRLMTKSTPLQFHKLLRLQEARRLLLDGAQDVTNTSVSVGYASTPQFIREYRKTFGITPGRDVVATTRGNARKSV